MKKVINVPVGIRYIGEWKDYSFQNFPPKCIVDKQIPGCGYTEWCIGNNQNVILASPRRILLQNKEEQHEGEVFLALNNLDQDRNIDKDMSRLDKKGEIYLEASDEDKKTTYELLYQRLNEFIVKKSDIEGKPIKILVTYDSYGMIKSILDHLGIFNKFWTVVDEFQTILHDARFKSSTEVQFMEVLKSVERVQFISATPMMDKYLAMLTDFKDLPYYELDWGALDPYRILTPDIRIRTMRSVGTKIKEDIDHYKQGKYEKAILPDGRVVISDEAVFYVNSVNHIVSAIRSNQLQPDEVNILCSDTAENRKKIKRLNSKEDSSWRLSGKFDIGSVPLRGEKPKKYTFCTRTVYLGADFYSECARSFVYADSNMDCLAVDVMQDLPQIMGRQRLSTNPWKNSVSFYVRSTIEKLKKDPSVFTDFINRKIRDTNGIISLYEKGDDFEKDAHARQCEVVARVNNYRENYVAANHVGGKLLPVFNEYAYVSDIRAFDIQQNDYATQFSVFALISKLTVKQKDEEVSAFFEKYSVTRTIQDKLKMACEFMFSHSPEQGDLLVGLLNDIDVVKKYLTELGPEKCRSYSYQTGRLAEVIKREQSDQIDISLDVYVNFDNLIGRRLEKTEIKGILQKVYVENNIKSIATATDLERWYELKSVKVNRPDGTRINGYKILKRK